ncbi:YceI family protein [Simiduia sp. 21SJ11W-1]|uniref:YceI family protein n=1 Tax=Simiduia sp. 21SJ11W-1 TaxID=2909669 RepID=UPI00209F044E|nr:YceI family protein [Simiduia sp. 21SJ11W-1]UTA46833.1 YceI family protein [Simiduia sp. 21SJ11W-1]
MFTISPKFFAMLFIAGLLTACGGGGGGSESGSTDTPATQTPDTGSGDQTDNPTDGDDTPTDGGDTPTGGDDPVDAKTQQWSLQSNQSLLNFVMTKKLHVAEVGRFTMLNGAIYSDGSGEFQVELGSVDTANGTRDQRLRDLLFEVARFPVAEVFTRVDPALIESLAVGSEKPLTVAIDVVLHGVQQTLNADVLLAKIAADRLLVRTRAPLLLDATAFELQAGIDELKALAGLTSIGATVPVDVQLVFVRNEEVR